MVFVKLLDRVVSCLAYILYVYTYAFTPHAMMDSDRINLIFDIHELKNRITS